MVYESLVNKNPLRVLNLGTGNRKMGLIMARAGLGKTALLVQIALDSILRGNRVIHVSIGESIEKNKIWYNGIIDAILKEHVVTHPDELIEMVNRHRMIMTFQADTFNRVRLEERLSDLILQDIFRPNCLVVDGFDFENADRAAIDDLKEFTESMSLHSWFSAISHRGDSRVSPTGVPAPCHEMDDLFDTIVLLKPESDATIELEIIRNSDDGTTLGRSLKLDPSTMMVKEG
jgi:hypothetical protein